jgi:hypothetical protein
MLSSFITNSIGINAQCGESLCEIISKRKDVEMMILLYFSVEHWRNVELLAHQYHWA